MKKVVFLSLLCIVAIIYTYNSLVVPPNKSSALVKNIPTSHTEPINNIQLLSPKEPMHKAIIQIDTTKSYSSYVFFENEDIDDTLLKMGKIKNVTPIAAIKMKQNMIKNLKVGDRLTLPSIDGNIYELRIQNHFITERGNTSIDGNFSESGISYSTVLTEGRNSAFMSMNTPSGTYEIEFVNGVGLVYESADIENIKIDYNKSDIIHLH